MNLPHPDLNLCKCLIIEQHQAVESVNKVVELSNLLETCEFQMFWQELDRYPELIEGITGFRESIKNFIASVLKVTIVHQGELCHDNRTKYEITVFISFYSCFQ